MLSSLNLLIVLGCFWTQVKCNSESEKKRTTEAMGNYGSRTDNSFYKNNFYKKFIKIIFIKKILICCGGESQRAHGRYVRATESATKACNLFCYVKPSNIKRKTKYVWTMEVRVWTYLHKTFLMKHERRTKGRLLLFKWLRTLLMLMFIVESESKVHMVHHHSTLGTRCVLVSIVRSTQFILECTRCRIQMQCGKYNFRVKYILRYYLRS